MHHRLLYQTPLPNNPSERLALKAIKQRLTEGLEGLTSVFECLAAWRLHNPDAEQRAMMTELETLATALRPTFEAALLAAERLAERGHQVPSQAFVQRPVSHVPVLETLAARCLEDTAAVLDALKEAAANLSKLDVATLRHATDVFNRQHEDATAFLETVALWKRTHSHTG